MLNSTSRRFSTNLASGFTLCENAFLPKDSLKNRICIITGGSSGLGKSMADRFLELGARVVITSRRQQAMYVTRISLDLTSNDTVALLSSKHANTDRIIGCRTDVRSPDEISKLFDFAESSFGSVANTIINNAAGNFVSPFERLSPQGFKTIVDICLNGTALVTLEAGRRLIDASSGGVVLNISTTYASSGSSYVVPSAVAKAGVECLVKSLASEWGRKYGIRFVGIAVGTIEVEEALVTAASVARNDLVAKKLACIPAGRRGSSLEFSNLAAYLVSDYASWINGDVLTFDGGEAVYNSGEYSRLFEELSEEDWDAIHGNGDNNNKSKEPVK